MARSIKRAGNFLRAFLEKAAYIRKKPDLIRKIPELHGKILGCWCVDTSKDPKCSTCGKILEKSCCGHYQCHGEVLICLLEEIIREKTEYNVSDVYP